MAAVVAALVKSFVSRVLSASRRQPGEEAGLDGGVLERVESETGKPAKRAVKSLKPKKGRVRPGELERLLALYHVEVEEPPAKETLALFSKPNREGETGRPGWLRRLEESLER